MINDINNNYKYGSEPYKAGKKYVGRDGGIYTCLGFDPCKFQGKIDPDDSNTACPNCVGKPRWSGLPDPSCCHWNAGYLRECKEQKMQPHFEVGKTYGDKLGRVVQCIGFEPCRYQDGPTDEDCRTCPGHVLWDDGNTAACDRGQPDTDLHLYEIPGTRQEETMEDRVRRMTEQVRKEVKGNEL